MAIDFTEYRFSSETSILDNGFKGFLSESFCVPCGVELEPLVGRSSCSRCGCSPSTTWYNNTPLPHHILRFKCDSCKILWNTCITCSSNQCNADFRPVPNRLSMAKRIELLDYQCQDHQLRFHSDLIVDPHINENGGTYESPDHPDEDHNNTHVTNDLRISFDSMLNQVFSNDENIPNTDYLREALFHRESTKKYPDFLVMKYWMKTNNCDLPEQDVRIFLRMVKLMRLCSRDDLIDLSFIIDGLCRKHEEERSELNTQLKLCHEKLEAATNLMTSMVNTLTCNNIVLNDKDLSDFQELQSVDEGNSISISNNIVQVPMPRTVKMMRQIIESKNGFLSACPIPQIHLHASGCAYVLPSDALKMSLCFGVPIEHVRGKEYNINGLHRRSIYRCNSIRTRIRSSEVPDDSLTLVLGYWSDGCICGTDSKGGRNSAKTITIHIPHPSMTIRHVFPICFGRKQSDWSEVIQIILDDLKELTTVGMKCYIPALHNVVHIHVLFGYAIQDRPEHAETTSFMSSGGTFSKRVGISCPVNIKRNNQMTQLDVDGDGSNNTSDICEKQLPSCTECHTARIRNFCAGQFYAASRSSNRCQRCYDWDMMSVHFKPNDSYPRDMIPNSDHDVGAGNFEYILKAKKVTFQSMRNAVSTIYSKIHSRTWRKKDAEQYSRTECIRHHTMQQVYDKAVSSREEAVHDEEGIPQELLPPFWKQDMLELDDIHLGVMHYLFLNVGSHLVGCIKARLSGNRWKPVYNLWNDILTDVRAMSLSWCKCWTLGSFDKPGSVWVSENYLGFSMLCKTLSLSLRSLECMNETIPEVENACNAYYCLVSYVMSNEIPTSEVINGVSALAKIFLTCIQRLDDSVESERSENKVETASCFVNLLAISDKMESFGIMRNYWEGGVKGEGVFLWLKRIVKRGLHTPGVTVTILRRLYEARSIEELIKIHEDQQSYVSFVESQTVDGDLTNDELLLDDPLFNAERYRRFHAYSNVEEVQRLLEEKRPLSLMFHKNSTDNHGYYALIGKKSKKEKKVVKVSFIGHVVYFSTKIFNVELEGEVHPISSVSDVASHYISCLLLPMFYNLTIRDGDEERTEVERKYYLISEDHKEYGRGGRFVFPSVNEIVNVEEDFHGNNNVQRDWSLPDIEFCCNRILCRSLEGRQVQAIDDCEFGKVVKFRYINGIVIPQNAVWTVNYYETVNSTRAKMREECNYLVLKELLEEPIVM